jgi:hypothetical protein
VDVVRNVNVPVVRRNESKANAYNYKYVRENNI